MEKPLTITDRLNVLNQNVDNESISENSYEFEQKVSSETNVAHVKLRVTAEKSMFQSALGGIISCLGSAVGTGNIWRFPRILASHSYSTGALTFYIVWLIILFLWSIPIIIVEYSIGRFTRNSVTLAFCKFFGQKFFWLGGWMVAVVFFVRIPVLFSKVGIFGRVLCALFFLCLVFAGISSLLSLTQVHVLAMKDFNALKRSHGCDPYNPSTYVNKDDFQSDEIDVEEMNVFNSSNTVQTRL
ncbi:uncharacterized protein DC041_0001996 [Schistosoma bovis]|uniref:Uncharacterized protein n=1 Tax=Schistosoma bovis TaxID=6184 RepID=A0A430QK49_SCHBO|nr:uncharacterized protein DC041_0001996 [Schistosoma bovis]